MDNNLTTFHPDYLYAYDLNTLNNKVLYEECHKIETKLKLELPSKESGWYGNYTSASNESYNALTFPLREMSSLYFELQKVITPFLNPSLKYAIKCWINIYRKGEKVNWHSHWPPQFKVWHGFYCVNVGDPGTSSTLYRIPNKSGIIEVPSLDGRLVFGKSDGDTHKSTDWIQEDKARVTIAFDIIPIQKHFHPQTFDGLILNHFIPFKN